MTLPVDSLRPMLRRPRRARAAGAGVAHGALAAASVRRAAPGRSARRRSPTTSSRRCAAASTPPTGSRSASATASSSRSRTACSSLPASTRPRAPASRRSASAWRRRRGPLAGLELAGDGTVQVLAGAPKVTRGANGTRYKFSDDAVAELRDNGEGFTFASGGAVPVTLAGRQRARPRGRRRATTLVIDRLGPQGIDAKVANRLDGVDIDHQLFFDVDLLNFSELAPARQAAQTGRRLQNLINRGVVGSLTPR